MSPPDGNQFRYVSSIWQNVPKSSTNQTVMQDALIQKSKLLARWLRHKPDAIGLRLDKNGWAEVGELLRTAAAAGHALSHDELMRVVAENDKQRFSLSEDSKRIRAAQGHSVPIQLNAPVKAPPPVLYHGTVGKFMASIRKNGLQPGTRQHVHLSATRETAEAVGARRGKAVVLVIETYPLVRDGFEFRLSENGVWLIDAVPPKYLKPSSPRRSMSSATTGKSEP